MAERMEQPGEKSGKILALGLLVAATHEEWEKVDNEIIPELSASPKGDDIARELLTYSDDDNPNIRDGVATGLCALEIHDRVLFEQAIVSMATQASSDTEIFPAGRAALFLGRYVDDKDYKGETHAALAAFKARAVENGWVDELIAEIPGMPHLLEVIWNY